jgi:hypothetical protein
VPGVPQASSISFICFTDIKLRSHWPSVMPSARVLIRLPLHVNFSVEAAFASAIALKTSAQMQPIARRLGMLAIQNTIGINLVRRLSILMAVNAASSKRLLHRGTSFVGLAAVLRRSFKLNRKREALNSNEREAERRNAAAQIRGRGQDHYGLYSLRPNPPRRP